MVTSGKFGISVDEYKPKINLRKSILIVALVIILAAVAVWLLSRENFYDMIATVRNANHLMVALAIIVYFLSVGLWAIRWQVALSFIHHRINFGTRYLILCATIFLNNITPGARVGGDPFGRLYMLRRMENMNYSTGMASLVGERALTPLIIISFFMAGWLFQYGIGSVQLTLIIVIAWILAACAAVGFPRLFFRKRIAVRGISRIMHRFQGWFGKSGNARGIIEGVETFYSSSYATLDRWKKVLAIGSLTLALGIFDVFRLYIIFVALGYYPSIPILLIASSIPTIVGIVPFLPGGLLLVEGSLISILTLLGVPLNLALAATLIERGISFFISTAVGAVVFSYLGIKMAAKPEVQS